MMLIASLVEFAIAKLRMWQTHNAQSANFDVASFAYSGYRCTATGGFKLSLRRSKKRRIRFAQSRGFPRFPVFALLLYLRATIAFDRLLSSFHSSRNAVYVWAHPAPVAQPDRATDF
jgi:hypothetical protein